MPRPNPLNLTRVKSADAGNWFDNICKIDNSKYIIIKKNLEGLAASAPARAASAPARAASAPDPVKENGTIHKVNKCNTETPTYGEKIGTATNVIKENAIGSSKAKFFSGDMEIHGNKDSYFFKGCPKDSLNLKENKWFNNELKASFNSKLVNSKNLNLHKYCVHTEICGREPAEEGQCTNIIYLASVTGKKPNITSIGDLQKIATDIIKGIQELETVGLFHNDIATRNIMQFGEGAQKKYKLIDFGATTEESRPADMKKPDIARPGSKGESTDRDYGALITTIHDYLILKKVGESYTCTMDSDERTKYINRLNQFFIIDEIHFQPKDNYPGILKLKNFIPKLFENPEQNDPIAWANSVIASAIPTSGSGKKTRRGGGRKSRRGGVKKTRRGGGRMSRRGTRKKKK